MNAQNTTIRKRSYVLGPVLSLGDAEAGIPLAEQPSLTLAVALREEAASPETLRAPALPDATEHEALSELAASPAPTEAPGIQPDAPGLGVMARMLWSVVPSGLGVAAGWFVASDQGFDPVNGAALGAASGFLVGWVALTWIGRGNRRS